MSRPGGSEKIFCVRNEINKSVEEHLACPYCFGRVREVIESGELRRFCDFDPNSDPIVFGFPNHSSRNRQS